MKRLSLGDEESQSRQYLREHPPDTNGASQYDLAVLGAFLADDGSGRVIVRVYAHGQELWGFVRETRFGPMWFRVIVHTDPKDYEGNHTGHRLKTFGFGSMALPERDDAPLFYDAGPLRIPRDLLRRKIAWARARGRTAKITAADLVAQG